MRRSTSLMVKGLRRNSCNPASRAERIAAAVASAVIMITGALRSSLSLRRS